MSVLGLEGNFAFEGILEGGNALVKSPSLEREVSIERLRPGLDWDDAAAIFEGLPEKFKGQGAAGRGGNAVLPFAS